MAKDNRPYGDVFKSITDPILEHMDRLPDNLCFFLDDRRLPGSIHMPHGIADKRYHRREKLLQASHNLYPGPAWKEKLLKMGIPPEKIHIVGWPRLDPPFRGKIGYIPGPKKRVAWLPTHNANQEISSFPAFQATFDALPDKYEKITSIHPARRQNRKTSLEVLVNADVVISDTSGMLYEALSIGKPVILLDYLVKESVLRLLKGTFEETIYREKLCYHAESAEQLPELIEQALSNGISRKAKEFIDWCFPPELHGKSGEAAAKVLAKISKGVVFHGFKKRRKGVSTGKAVKNL